MKKTITLTIALIYSFIAFTQSNWKSGLKGMNVGVGVPIEFRDLKAAGTNLHLGFDCAYPINDKIALGFYISAKGGFLGSFKPYNKYDKFYSVFGFSAGLLVEFGELNNQPFILGISPCAGFGFWDMDLVLPVEFRFGRAFSNNWYVLGGLSYNISLAKETAGLEPSIHIGYNFGHKARERKK